MVERFLITGGQGFIGAWIARTLVEEGVECAVLDLETNDSILAQVLEPGDLARVGRIAVDITDTDAVTREIERSECTNIVHLAGLQVPTCRAEPVLGARVNVIGTLNVFEAARRSAGRVRSIVYASSAAVAGDLDDYEGPIRDQSQHVPRTHYGVFKAANEGNARVYFQDHGIPSVGLRPYTVYGVGREVGMTSGPTKAIKAAVLGRPYEIAFTGMTSFVFARDLARIAVGAARAEHAGALALNIRGTVDSVESFLDALHALLPESRERVRATGDPIRIAYDVDETGLHDLLGGSVPATPLAEGIRQSAEHFAALAEAGRLHDRDLES